jgi:hypothetical protein
MSISEAVYYLLSIQKRKVIQKKAKNKKAKIKSSPYLFYAQIIVYQAFKVYSSETVSFFLPFARRAAKTRLPLAEAILSRKPCLFLRFLFEGWNVLFIVNQLFYGLFYSKKSDCKDITFFLNCQMFF